MTRRVKWIAALTSVGLVAGTCLAQSGSSQSSGQYGTRGQAGISQSESSTQSQTSSQGAQFCDVKKLLGQQVKDQQGQELGKIQDLLISPRHGATLAAVEVQNDRWALVPVQALNISGSQDQPTITLNTTKEHLQSGPTVQQDNWQAQLDSPGFARSVYTHYRSETGMGGAGSMGGAGGLGGSSSGSSSQQPGSSSSSPQQPSPYNPPSQQQ
jgi:hypothetical protein